MERTPTKNQSLKKGYSFANLPLPVQAIGPRSVIERGRHFDRDILKELRAEQKQQKEQKEQQQKEQHSDQATSSLMDVDMPPRTPKKPRPTSVLSPRKRKDPMSILFIPKKPVPVVDAKQSKLARKVPYPSPFSPRSGRKLIHCGPCPGVYNAIVHQTSFCPTGEEFDMRDPNAFVVFGKVPETGCLLFDPDAVSQERFEIPYQRIVIKFQWTGYEACGIWEREFEIDHNDHFESRILIIQNICAEFLAFKKAVRNMVLDKTLTVPEKYPDALALGKFDVRVLGLQRCHDFVYKPVFTVPARRRGD